MLLYGRGALLRDGVEPVAKAFISCLAGFSVEWEGQGLHAPMVFPNLRFAREIWVTERFD